MAHYPFQHTYNDISRLASPQHKSSIEMAKSMVAEGGNLQNFISNNRIARLSEFLPQNLGPEEMTANNPMLLTSRKNRKYSEAVFNRELMQHVNRSKLFESKIVEPLKFGDKDKIKSPKVQQQINKTHSEKSELTKQSQQLDTVFNNRSHLVFGSSKIEKNKFASPKLYFTPSPKKDSDKEDSTSKKSVINLVNIHTKEMHINPEDKNQFNILKCRSPPLVKAKTADYSYQRQKCFGEQLDVCEQVLTPESSTPVESNGHKKSQTFSTSNMTSFFKKVSVDERMQNSSPFKKAKEVQTKDGSNCELTPTESLRSSLDQLNRQDFYFGKRLGKGKFGEVFLVKHKEIGFLCAMKIIPKKVVHSEKIENQLCSQIKIQIYLSHPNIVSLYGIFSDKQNIYLLMEPCLDGQLYHLIKKKKRIPEKQTSLLVRQICIAVDYLHVEKIIHRDLKPENILLSEGVIKVCDFGWAVFHNDQFRDTFCGTPLYLSPELLNQNTYDDKVDNWAIGILTYEMLYGRIPFKISNKQQLQKILFQEIIFPDFIEVSQEAKNFILVMLERNPQKRAELQSCLNHPFFNCS